VVLITTLPLSFSAKINKTLSIVSLNNGEGEGNDNDNEDEYMTQTMMMILMMILMNGVKLHPSMMVMMTMMMRKKTTRTILLRRMMMILNLGIRHTLSPNSHHHHDPHHYSRQKGTQHTPILLPTTFSSTCSTVVFAATATTGAE